MLAKVRVQVLALVYSVCLFFLLDVGYRNVHYRRAAIHKERVTLRAVKENKTLYRDYFLTVHIPVVELVSIVQAFSATRLIRCAVDL